jgi:hypothetical protein
LNVGEVKMVLTEVRQEKPSRYEGSIKPSVLPVAKDYPAPLLFLLQQSIPSCQIL